MNMAATATMLQPGSISPIVLDRDGDGHISSLASGPLPLPDFVFPARPTSSTNAVPPRPRAMVRPVSASGIQHRNAWPMSNIVNDPPPLPTFVFGTASTAPPKETPPTSPGTRRSAQGTSSDKPKQGPSVYDTTTSSIADTAPGTGQSVATSAEAPSGRRRGHAHRRSAAMSCHDLSAILKPSTGNVLPRSGSAPTSPSEQADKVFPDIADATNPRLLQRQSTPEMAMVVDDSPVKTSTRTRVGFSDNVEFIPRPLSIVSSDASSTMTVRPGHSVSNSMSSIVSGSTSSSPASKHATGLNLGRSIDESRPWTAGPVLDQSGLCSSTRSSPRPGQEVSTSTPHSPTSPKLPRKPWSLFSTDSSDDCIISRTQVGIADDAEVCSRITPPLESSRSSSDFPSRSSARTNSRSSIGKKAGKKVKKGRTLAGLLHRKPMQRGRSQKSNTRRSPTPPLRHFSPLHQQTELDSEGVVPNGDVNDASKEKTSVAGEGHLQIQIGSATWEPRSSSVPEEDSLSPVIDLDAALGPFNTPTSYDPAWDFVSKESGFKPRKMHSAAGVCGFGGNNAIMYHRRAESAPEFENPRFKFGRLGSSSTMADVFEEDEEDEDCSSSKASDTAFSVSRPDIEAGLGIEIHDAESVQNIMTTIANTATNAGEPGLMRKKSAISDDARTFTTVSTRSEKDLPHESIILHDMSQQIEIVSENGSRPVSRAQSEASGIAYRNYQIKHLEPVDIPVTTMPSPFSQMATASPLDSPRTPLSDSARIFSTAPSSISEDNTTESLMMGEPGPELIRMSVEDVPSLSSANSTTTRESAYFQAPLQHQNQPFASRDSNRPNSISGPSLAKKRSSMASLSRLISSSHGERSKLSIESRPASVIDPERPAKSKSKRVSRLMNFWRPRSIA